MKRNEELVKKYLLKKIKVSIYDAWQPTGIFEGEGLVLNIDDLGQLHGTWGGLAAIPGVDDIIILDEGENND